MGRYSCDRGYREDKKQKVMNMSVMLIATDANGRKIEK